MRNNKYCLLILLSIWITVVSSCSMKNEQEDDYANKTNPTELNGELTEKATKDQLPSNTGTPYLSSPTMEVTLTSLPPKGFAELPDGEYLLFQKGDSLELMSIDTRIQKSLLKAIDITLSPDSRNVVVVSKENESPSLVNLETMDKEGLPFLKDCWEISLSPDNKYFLGSCFSEKERSIEVYLFTRDGKQTVQVSNCAEDKGDCSGAAFSPDGEWISYYRNVSGSFETSKVGLYLLKIDCIPPNKSCGTEPYGPFKIASDFEWSRSGEFLASSGDKGIAIYKLMDNQTIVKDNELLEAPSMLMGDYIIWSLDSRRIAYSTGNQIKIVTIANGVSVDLKSFDQSVYLLGWIRLSNGKARN